MWGLETHTFIEGIEGGLKGKLILLCQVESSFKLKRHTIRMDLKSNMGMLMVNIY
jgi:hypothetical protein